MEGRLVGDWAEEAKLSMINGAIPRGLIVDLTEVTYVDSIGEKVLAWFASIGALFAADAVYAAELCERLQLPLQRKSAIAAAVSKDSRLPPSNGPGVSGRATVVKRS